MTQTEQVLAILRERGEDGITALDALDEVGSFRLAARISDAKKLIGPEEEIVTLRATTLTGKSIARYVLRKRKPGPNLQATIWGW